MSSTPGWWDENDGLDDRACPALWPENTRSLKVSQAGPRATPLGGQQEVKCPFCGAPANSTEEDEPSVWKETEDDFVSLHGYVCIVSGEHQFFTTTCKL